jgi:hypothetical protein
MRRTDSPPATRGTRRARRHKEHEGRIILVSLAIVPEKTTAGLKQARRS